MGRTAKQAAKRRRKERTTRSQEPDTREFLDSLPDRRSMEGALFGMFKTRGDRDLRDAQSIMYRAFGARDPRTRISLAREALARSENCADAYVLLAEEKAGSLEAALDCYRRGVEAGERALGKTAFKRHVGHFWGVLETRPYMRARLGLGQCLWALGRREEALEHYRELLRLNPDDNQGIRDLLTPALLELGRDEEAEELLARFHDDVGADGCYGRALVAFRRFGDAPESRKRLAGAVKCNPHVPDYLLGRRRIPREQPDYVRLGGETEAARYAAQNRRLWQATDGALAWLAASDKA